MTDTTGLHAQFRALFGQKENLAATQQVPREHVFEYLAGVGVDSVLEYIAAGRLPAELAIYLDFPILYVQEWIDEHVDTARMRAAMRAYAQSCVLKAQLTLQASPDSPQEAQAMRAMSEHLTWAAERADSDTWGPPKKAAEAPPPVSIVFNLPPPPPKAEPLPAQPEFARIIEHASTSK